MLRTVKLVLTKYVVVRTYFQSWFWQILIQLIIAGSCKVPAKLLDKTKIDSNTDEKQIHRALAVWIYNMYMFKDVA